MEAVYYGVDLHSSQITNHIVKKVGNSQERMTEKVYLNELERKFIPYLNKNCYLCVEASTGTFAFVKRVEPYVKKVVVINPYDFKSLYCSNKKTDKIDAKKLANRLKYHIENEDEDDDFPEVFMPEEKTIILRKLFSTYKLLKQNSTSLKNRISSIFKSNLLNLKYENIIKFENKDFLSLKIEDCDKFQVELLKDQIESLESKSEIIKKKILSTGYNTYKEEIKLLISIKGISVFTACAIMADIGDISRFTNYKRLSSYLRSVPRVDSSGETTKLGRIGKKGRKLSFEMILQGLHHVIKSNPDFQMFYDRKTKGKSKNKVRGAIVRKTIVAIFYILKKKELYKYCDKKNYEQKLKEFEKIIFN